MEQTTLQLVPESDLLVTHVVVIDSSLALLVEHAQLNVHCFARHRGESHLLVISKTTDTGIDWIILLCVYSTKHYVCLVHRLTRGTSGCLHRPEVTELKRELGGGGKGRTGVQRRGGEGGGVEGSLPLQPREERAGNKKERGGGGGSNT